MELTIFGTTISITKNPEDKIKAEIKRFMKERNSNDLLPLIKSAREEFKLKYPSSCHTLLQGLLKIAKEVKGIK